MISGIRESGVSFLIPQLGGRTIVLNDILIIIACVSAAVLFLFLVTRASSAPSRKESNDFTGAVVAVIGTTYAVLLAFMLAGVWTMFQQAQANEEQEANALVNLYRIAAQVREPNGRQIQEICRRYADNAVSREFQALEHGQMSTEGNEMIDQLWKLAGQSEVRSNADSIVVYQLIEELRGLTEHRRLRAMQGREQLPVILWVVLIAGGVITVAASCLFGVPNFRFHLLQVLVLTFLISLVLVAIEDIDRPYQGLVKVEPEGFQFAVRTLHSEPSQ